MKKIEWATPNRIKIDTGHKTFDRQTNLITTGNVVANTVYGGFIRGWEDEGEGLMDYPENKRPHGQLFEFDCKPFLKSKLMRRHVYAFLKDMSKSVGKMIYYALFHHGPGGRVFHGCVITKSYEEEYQLITTWVHGPTRKSDGIVAECAKYVSNSRPEYREPTQLRAIHVTYGDGTEYATDMAADLTDQQMLDYFAVGKEFNIGDGPNDNMQQVKSRRIIR